MVSQLASESRFEGDSTEEIQEVAEQLVTKILGQRCSRVGWTDLNLYAKDNLKQAPFKTQGAVLRSRRQRGLSPTRIVRPNPLSSQATQTTAPPAEAVAAAHQTQAALSPSTSLSRKLAEKEALRDQPNRWGFAASPATSRENIGSPKDSQVDVPPKKSKV